MAKARPQTASSTPSAAPAPSPRPDTADDANDAGGRRALEDQVAPARPREEQYARTSDGDSRGGAERPASDNIAQRQTNEAVETANDKQIREGAAKIDGLWATLKRQQEAGDLAAAEKTLAALQTLGADAARIKAAQAHVADLKRQKAAATKVLPATRTME